MCILTIKLCSCTLDTLYLVLYFISRSTRTYRARDERVEWLYSGPAGGVNREEYLLGRKIDRLVDPVLAEEEKEKEVSIHLCGLLYSDEQ